MTTDPTLEEFVVLVAEKGRELYRDFSWRRTHDPYAVLVSEVMLQQTQVSRVERRFDEWLADFPALEALAAAPLEAVLESWQGLGYNRRAVALKRAAEQVVADSGGKAPATLPADEASLRALPGIGPATAAGVLAFAFGRPSVYLETNVRGVFLHELFADRDGVPDREIVPLVAAAVEEAGAPGSLGQGVVLRAPRLRCSPQAHPAQPVAAQRPSHAAVALRGVAPAEARMAAPSGAGRPGRDDRRACARALRGGARGGTRRHTRRRGPGHPGNARGRGVHRTA